MRIFCFFYLSLFLHGYFSYGQEAQIEILDHSWQVEENGQFLLVKGKSYFSVDVVLKAQLRFLSSLGELVVKDSLLRTHEGVYAVQLGPFPLNKMIPGKYAVYVYYSPMFQREKNNPKMENVSFVESQQEMTLGTKEEYKILFEARVKEAQSLLSEIQRLYELIQREFFYSKEHRKMDSWYRWYPKWQKQLAELRKKEEHYRNRFYFPLFPTVTQNVFPLLNLLEDTGESYQESLHDPSHSLLDIRSQRFLRLYQKTDNHFNFEKIALSFNSQRYLEKEILSLLLKEDSTTSLIENGLDRVTNKEKQELLLYLLELQGLYDDLKRQAEETQSKVVWGKKSNQWLLSAKTKFSEMEMKTTSLMLIPYSKAKRSLLFSWWGISLQKSFLGRKSKKLLGIVFEEELAHLLQKYGLKKVPRYTIKNNFEEFKKQIEELLVLVQKNSLDSYTKKNYVQSWTSQLLTKQKIHQKLVSFQPEDLLLQKAHLFYSYMCMELIDLQDIFVQLELTEERKSLIVRKSQELIAKMGKQMEEF